LAARVVIDADYRGRALIELIGDDVHITVRAAYPLGLLDDVTDELRWLQQEFWKGLQLQTLVPCQTPCGLNEPGRGLFDVSKLVESVELGLPRMLCGAQGCKAVINIDDLLSAARSQIPAPDIADQYANILRLIAEGFGGLSLSQVLSEVQKTQTLVEALRTEAQRQSDELLRMLTDEAQNGPRLFSLKPLKTTFLQNPDWVTAKLRLTLWCEYSLAPVPWLSGGGKGSYEIELPREWVKKAAPLLKAASNVLKLATLGAAGPLTDAIKDQADWAKDVTETVGEMLEKPEGEQSPTGIKRATSSSAEPVFGVINQATGGELRELHALLRKKDPGFGGLVRIHDKRKRILWVHPRFEPEFRPPPPVMK
jgi:hypothetical protein